jgi:hypothetical protein
MRRILIVVGILIALAAAGLVAIVFGGRHSLPDAAAGPDGDALAKKVEASIGVDAWNKLGVIRWTLGGKRHYLWDKGRGFIRTRIGDDEVLLDLVKMEGRAFRRGEEQSGAEKKQLIDAAYKWFCNDSFWLNPLVKLFDSGTSRAALTVDGKPALLISYSSGGVTPGDRYLWLLDDDAHPRAWRVWASVLKIVPGIEFTWEDWIDLHGAKIASSHRVIGLKVQPISDLDAAERIELLEPGPDPFAGLAAKR